MMDFKWSLHLVCLAVVLYVGTTVTEGCMCERWHPQQHFCASTYVIGGHILKREFVRVETDINPEFLGLPPAQLAPSLSLGEIEPPPEGPRPYRPGGGLHSLPDEPRGEGSQNPETEPYHPRGLQPLPQPEGLEPMSQPDGLQPAGLRPLEGLQEPGQRHPEDVGPPPPGQDLEAIPLPDEPETQPQGEGPEAPLEDPEEFKPLPHPEGLEPLPEESKPEALPPLPLPEELSPQDAPSNVSTSKTTSPPKAPETTLATKTSSNFTVTGTAAVEQQETTTTAVDPDFDPSNVDPWNYKIVYTIKIAHIYKTGKEESAWNIGDEVQLSTPAADSQCGQTSLKADRTYLVAGHRSGRVSLCDWVQEHHRLTTRQKQGLKLVYGKSCDTCHIKACPSARHCSKPKHNRATTCLYDASQVRMGHPYSPFDCLASHSRCTVRHGNKCKWQKNNDYHDCVKYHDQLP